MVIIDNIFYFGIGTTSNIFEYCIDGITVSINNETYDLSDGIASGIILSQECNFSFYPLSNDNELIYCNEGLFKIYTKYSLIISNSIIDISLATCSINNADIELSNLKNFNFNLIGKNSFSNNWDQSNTYSFDHITHSGYVDWNQIGTLMAVIEFALFSVK